MTFSWFKGWNIQSTNFKIPTIFFPHIGLKKCGYFIMTDDKAVPTFKSEKNLSLLGKKTFFSVKNGPFLKLKI